MVILLYIRLLEGVTMLFFPSSWIKGQTKRLRIALVRFWAGQDVYLSIYHLSIYTL
jgi:hypothetical protein